MSIIPSLSARTCGRSYRRVGLQRETVSAPAPILGLVQRMAPYISEAFVENWANTIEYRDDISQANKMKILLKN